MVTERLWLSTMTIIFIAIMLMSSMVITGCTTQPPPITMPIPSSTPMIMVVNERLMVIESLTQFNNASNNVVRLMSNSEDIYQLSGNRYHIEFIASKQVLSGLRIYKNVVMNWLTPMPHDNEHYDKLMDIKKAELYRIQHFSDLLKMMIDTLPSEDDETLKDIRAKFTTWSDDSRNQRSAELQNDILKELNISPDRVNFLLVPDISNPLVPPLLDDTSQGDNL